MPNGCNKLLPWKECSKDCDKLECKDFYGILLMQYHFPASIFHCYTDYFAVCHAELNAIVNTYGCDLKGCTLYVGLFPCHDCARLIIQSGIKYVVYFSDKKGDQDSFKASRRMFEKAGVHIRFFHY